MIPISYWTDPLCIWAFVAEAKVERITSEFGARIRLEHRVIPVFGSVPWRFSHGPWKNEGVDGRVAATRRIAAEHGRPEITGEVWRRAAPTSSWAAGAALKAVFAAAAHGEIAPDLAPGYQLRMRERFFVAEENVCERRVQLAIAEELSIPRASIERRLDDGSALAGLWEDFNDKEHMKLLGSPSWVFDDGRAQLYGNVGWGVLRATVEELVRGAAPGCSVC